MQLILLSGGSGKRLWPLSNDIRSKQFIKMFTRENGERESMVQRMYRQIKVVDAEAILTIATSKTQVSSIHNQLGVNVGISVEPCRRDTFPAIALATAYLHDVQKVSSSESVVVCPIDPYVDDDYFECLKDLCIQSGKGEANLVLMGIEPTYPSEKYGYIIPTSKDSPSFVSAFKEKPTEDIAKQYIAQGALWNGGVFAYKLSYVLRIAEKLLGTSSYLELYGNYENLTKISFDYAVVEHEKQIQVIRFAGQWKDIGTWNTFTEVMNDSNIGNVIMDDCCSNTNVVNELDIPIVAMGLHDVVVSASPEGILVSDKGRSSYIKPVVDKIVQQVMFAEKSWGSYKVIQVDKGSITVSITLNSGQRMNYHCHQKRDEIWIVIAGEGRTIVEGVERYVKSGDVITMAAGMKHTVFATTQLKMIEIQLGGDISVQDKQKFTL
ncbi:sugar phosphate nucleotidyltransferase [Macellibacteroides fermentans]|jgi:mannose-1-phosphate guanylyltransferase|uniref:sugar phosphate nucleotidyltransferase n=1 Tax=Macellibacteroides fermentans TaxID=879969 RepID=UPI00406C4CFB